MDEVVGRRWGRMATGCPFGAGGRPAGSARHPRGGGLGRWKDSRAGSGVGAVVVRVAASGGFWRRVRGIVLLEAEEAYLRKEERERTLVPAVRGKSADGEICPPPQAVGHPTAMQIAGG